MKKLIGENSEPLAPEGGSDPEVASVGNPKVTVAGRIHLEDDASRDAFNSACVVPGDWFIIKNAERGQFLVKVLKSEEPCSDYEGCCPSCGKPL